MENPYTDFTAYEGQVFTYRELCDLLHIEFKRGKAKELQLNQLRVYMDLDQTTIPRKIILKKIYPDTELQIVKTRGKSYPYIKNRLLQHLKEVEDVVSWTYTDLIRNLALVPDQYMEDRYEPAIISQSINKKYDSVDIEFLNQEFDRNFFSMSWTILKEIVRSAIRRMEEKDLISVAQSLQLFNLVPKTIQEDGKEKTVYTIDSHNLSSEEYAEYIAMRDEIIDAFGLTGPQELFYSSRSRFSELAKSTFARRQQAFIAERGYQNSRTLFIIALGEEGQNYIVDRRFLNMKQFYNLLGQKLMKEKDFKKTFPAPVLEEFLNRYFRSPFYH